MGLKMVLVAVLLFAMLSVSMAAPAVDNTEIVRNKRFIVGHHQLEDVIAQSSCAAYMSHEPLGWMYAVKRGCRANSPSCTKLCTDKKLQAQDNQTAKHKNWRCIGTLHVYFNRPATGNGIPPKLGLKDFYYGYGASACNVTGVCGPNYCCCVVS